MALSALSCGQKKDMAVKHMPKEKSSHSKMHTVKVVNAEDPICHMKTAEFTKDTAMYKNKVYGFCSAYCKDEFNKNPEKYVQK